MTKDQTPTALGAIDHETERARVAAEYKAFLAWWDSDLARRQFHAGSSEWLTWQARAALAPAAPAPALASVPQPVAAWMMQNQDGSWITIAEVELRRRPDWVRVLWQGAQPLYATPPVPHASVDQAEPRDLVVDQAVALRQETGAADGGQETPERSVAVRWRLHRFLDVAAGEGFELGGVDAADLFNELFEDGAVAQLAAAADGGEQDARDAARLNWIESQVERKGAVWFLPSGELSFVQVRTSDACDNYPPVEGLRNAIDAAMGLSSPSPQLAASAGKQEQQP